MRISDQTCLDPMCNLRSNGYAWWMQHINECFLDNVDQDLSEYISDVCLDVGLVCLLFNGMVKVCLKDRFGLFYRRKQWEAP